MLEEQVTVTAVDGQTAWVEAVPACGGCSQTCASALLYKLGRRRPPLAVRCQLAVQPGDRVMIGIDERALLWGSLLVYMLPLCGLLGGAALAELLASAWGTVADWPVLVSASVGFATSLIVVKQLPWLGIGALQPVVLRKILPLISANG